MTWGKSGSEDPRVSRPHLSPRSPRCSRNTRAKASSSTSAKVVSKVRVKSGAIATERAFPVSYTHLFPRQGRRETGGRFLRLRGKDRVPDFLPGEKVIQGRRPPLNLFWCHLQAVSMISSMSVNRRFHPNSLSALAEDATRTAGSPGLLEVNLRGNPLPVTERTADTISSTEKPLPFPRLKASHPKFPFSRPSSASIWASARSVSYTHLDVYKRQA